MPVQRLDLGMTPHIRVLTCGGTLRVRGSDHVEVMIESDDAQPDIATEGPEATISSPGAGCYIRLPRGGSLHIVEVSDDLRIKDIDGQITVERVGGDLSIRRVGALSVQTVRGGARLRSVSGPLTLGVVEQDAMLRDIGAPARIERIEGDLYGRDIPSGVAIGWTGGDLSLRTGFAREATFEFNVAGDSHFRIPSDASVRFVISGEARLLLDHGLEALTGDDHQIVVVGDGGATVTLTTGGSVRISRRGGESLGREFAGLFEDDLSAYLADLAAQLDARLGKLDAEIRDSLRASVRESLRASLRVSLQEAVREARKARHERRRPAHAERRAGAPSGFPGREEPVSEEEIIAVLQMLEEGKITVEEANSLLEALSGEQT
ncbi:MAG TPA: hypothetical protein ENI95_10470 [Chloroflexi bacterium]|nr:hypothetical protein [Chloroflexota bacterium]